MKIRTRKLVLTRAILANRKAKTMRNPLRTDPTRTTGMREHFCKFLDRQFDRLKADVMRAVGTEDWLGVGEPVKNVEARDELGRWRSASDETQIKLDPPDNPGKMFHVTTDETALREGRDVGHVDKTFKRKGFHVYDNEDDASYYRDNVLKRAGYKGSIIEVSIPLAHLKPDDEALGRAYIAEKFLPSYLKKPTANFYQPFVCNGEVGYFPSKGLIEVPDIRQPDPTSCGAAAAMSVGKYFGVGPDNLKQWVTDLGTSEEGTHPEPIVKYLRGLGMQVEAFQHGNLGTLDHYLEKGWPIMCCVQDYGPAHSWEHGHYLVVIGHGDSGYIFAQDPAMDNVMVDGHKEPISELGSLHKPGRVMIPEEDFISAWHDEDEHGVPYVRFGIAVGPAVTANYDPDQERDAGGRFSRGPSTIAREASERASELMPKVFQRNPLYEHYKAVLHARMAEKQANQGNNQDAANEHLDALNIHSDIVDLAKKGMDTNQRAHDSFYSSAPYDPYKPQKLKIIEMYRAMHEAHTNALTAHKKAAHYHNDELNFNTRWAFATSSGKLAAFGRWLKTRVDNLISGRSMREVWGKYVEAGWRKGAERAFTDTHQRQKWERHPDTIGTGFYQGGREEFLRSSFNHPESVEKVKLLAARTFTDLDGVTTAMSTKMARTLADGLTMGQHPHQIAATLVKDVDGIGRKRALLVARHNLIYAHAEGQLDNLERLGVEEVGVAVEWQVTDDDKLCPKCAALAGIVLKTKEAHGLIPYHVGCRCAWIPSFDPPSSPEEVEAAVEAGEVDVAPRGKGIFNVDVSKELRDKWGRWTKVKDPLDWGDRFFAGWLTKLSNNEMGALNHYSSEGYLTLNRGLRQGDTLGRNDESAIGALTEALQRSRIPHDVTVYRGSEKKFHDSRVVGEVFRDDGFVSTSLVSKLAKRFTGDPDNPGKHVPIIHMTILVPKGTHGGYVPYNPVYGIEHELLLQRGTRFKVMKKTANSMTLKVLRQDKPPTDRKKPSLYSLLMKKIFNVATPDRFTWQQGDVVTETHTTNASEDQPRDTLGRFAHVGADRKFTPNDERRSTRAVMWLLDHGEEMANVKHEPISLKQGRDYLKEEGRHDVVVLHSIYQGKLEAEGQVKELLDSGMAPASVSGSHSPEAWKTRLAKSGAKHIFVFSDQHNSLNGRQLGEVPGYTKKVVSWDMTVYSKESQ